MGKIVDYGERLFLILLAGPFLIAFGKALPTHPYLISIAVIELLSIALILIRRPGTMATAPYPIAIAFVGSAMPLFARPDGEALIPTSIGSTMMFAGLFLSIAAKLWLNRSFGIIAANRGVKRGGPYRMVRHPMYLGYIVTQTGFLLLNFSPMLLLFYFVAWVAQVLRVVEEERILFDDPAYRKFAQSTRWRVLPGVF